MAASASLPGVEPLTETIAWFRLTGSPRIAATNREGGAPPTPGTDWVVWLGDPAEHPLRMVTVTITQLTGESSLSMAAKDSPRLTSPQFGPGRLTWKASPIEPKSSCGRRSP